MQPAYTKRDGSSAFAVACIILALAERTSDADGEGVELGDRGVACLTLDVTDAAGTSPTLDVDIETSADNGDDDAWRAVASFTQATTVGSDRKSFTGLDRFVRAVWAMDSTISDGAVTPDGTTPPTVTVAGEPSSPELEVLIEIDSTDALSAVTATGASPPTVTVSGTPDASDYSFVVQVDSVDLLTAVASAGTTPPVVTASGTPTASSLDFQVEVTTGGARGTAIFRWSQNGGSTWTSGVTTAATTVLGSTGVTLAWATGTDYTNDNVYTFAATGKARGTATFRWSLDGGSTWEESTVLTAATVVLGTTGVTAAFAVGNYRDDNQYTFAPAGRARGTATFRWSLDDGDTWEHETVATAATTVLGSTGVTVTWAVGNYHADVSYAFAATGDDPSFTFSVTGDAK